MAADTYSLYVCPECGYHGISGVSGGVGPWPGDGRVRCPSRTCEYSIVMEHRGVLALTSRVPAGDEVSWPVIDHEEALAALRWIASYANVPADFPNQPVRLRQIMDRARETLAGR